MLKLNQVCLLGRISSKELTIEKVGSAGTSKLVFNIAVPRQYKNAKGEYEADFPRIVAWKGTAEFVQKYAKTGTMVLVEGRIQTSSYKGSDGKMVYLTEVIADNITVDSNSGQTAVHEETQTEEEDLDDYAGIDISDEDLPY